MTLIWTLVDQDILTTDFHSSKSCFFFLVQCEKPKILQFPFILKNKGATWPKRPQQEGTNLDQIQKYFVWYWDQYQGFKAPAFWLTDFFQKSASPYYSVSLG
jgi:hypothetical protein